MKKILLLLSEGFEIYEASVFIDVFGWNFLEGDGSTKLVTCGLRKEIQSSFNQRFIVDFLIDEINIKSFDALAVPGGFEEYGFYTDSYDPKFLNIIKGFNAQNKPIASICVGALPLGKSGILSGKKATTYNNEVRKSTLSNYGAELENKPIVVQENIITSWNPQTAVDVAFLLLEKLTNSENTNNVRSLMGFSKKY